MRCSVSVTNIHRQISVFESTSFFCSFQYEILYVSCVTLLQRIVHPAAATAGVKYCEGLPQCVLGLHLTTVQTPAAYRLTFIYGGMYVPQLRTLTTHKSLLFAYKPRHLKLGVGLPLTLLQSRVESMESDRLQKPMLK